MSLITLVEENVLVLKTAVFLNGFCYEKMDYPNLISGRGTRYRCGRGGRYGKAFAR